MMIDEMLNSWQFWLALLAWIVGHATHSARLEIRQRVSENRLKRIEDWRDRTD